MALLLLSPYPAAILQVDNSAVVLRLRPRIAADTVYLYIINYLSIPLLCFDPVSIFPSALLKAAMVLRISGSFASGLFR